jgi:hypothetical protein
MSMFINTIAWTSPSVLGFTISQKLSRLCDLLLTTAYQPSSAIKEFTLTAIDVSIGYKEKLTTRHIASVE